ncbi:bifunctional DNA-formamidopyrimidine glycosylase/DNA-(apurinic or apyrimidinic site) lyase [Natronospora cellulosivora (SeqCode)]
MPELPEVETIVRGLRDMIEGRTIVDVIIRVPQMIAFPALDEFENQIMDREIIGLARRGKYILVHLQGKKTMVVHLRMTGRLLVKAKEVDYNKHSHVIFQLDNNFDLRFHNVRKFGRIYLIDSEEYAQAGGLAKLGPEPLSKEFNIEYFSEFIKKRKTNIKALLLNQSFIAGLGNIYADEALFLAGILPQRSVDTLKSFEMKKLFTAIQIVLEKAIKAGGTSFSDYRNAQDKKGYFQNELNVYQRDNQECLKCGEIIEKTKVAGRGTHFCPHCQR